MLKFRRPRARLMAPAGLLIVVAATALLAGPPPASAAERHLCVPAAPVACAASASPQQTSREAELAEKYAPVVYLKEQKEPCDSYGDAYAPVAVEAVLGNPDVVLRNDDLEGSEEITAPKPGDLFGLQAGYYLDFPGSPANPGCTYDQAFREIATRVPNVTYAHIVMEEGEAAVALQYWFYYYFNDWNNNHESDWEMIQLVFDATSVEEALEEEPVKAGYSQHAGGERAEWDSDKVRKEDGRPVVYVASGSHSNQFGPDNYIGRAEEGGAGFGCDDATPPSRRIELEARLLPASANSEDDEFAWITYEGQWGEKAKGHNNGPTGPNRKGQWTEPITWYDEKLRDSNVQIPSGKTAGPSATNAFCGIVAFVSNRLFVAFETWPLLLPLLLIGAIGGTFVTVRNTDFAVVREPLRRRRRFGQILRSAANWYRSSAGLMLSIALVFVPAGFIASGIQTLIFDNPPVKNILDVASLPEIVEAIAGLALGIAVFGLAYAFVVSGVVAALRETEAQRPVSALGAYRIVFEHLARLAIARARAVATVVLLSISVVGIPWAVNRAVRWLFIEQAILLDGADRRVAPRLSSDAVRGHWWRVFAISSLLNFVGLATGLLVVTPILLFTTVPLGWVNAMSSAIYVAVAPFVALAYTLLYFDGRASDLPEGDAAD